jgi:hypothetical protein
MRLAPLQPSIAIGSVTSTGAIMYHALDALGSTAETVNGGDGQVTQMRYYPYGEVQNGTSSEYMWTNEIRDPNGNDPLQSAGGGGAGCQ